MPGLTKCHYEVLGIDRNATDEDIKKSFRKLALQMHPDKNPDRMDEAKEEFQMLQQAYETLSNPQERAWYDEHRTALLKGGLDADMDEDIIDIFPYMTSTCYKGFGDDDGGFYAIYRDLFEKLAAEEYDAIGDSDSDEEIPLFGDSLSQYDDVVGPFYAYWESYCTRQNFGWMDEYDTRRASHRRVARLMDKENKKLRAKARQAWNQKVRALVDFVKRKDKRVQAWKVEQERLLKEKEEALKKKQADEKAKLIKERQKLFEQVKSSKQKHLQENQDQLEQLESWMVDEFKEGDEFIDEDDEDDIMMEYCHPCQKAFRTKKALRNHEKSKKHLAQLEKWAAENNIFTDSEEEVEGEQEEEVAEEAVAAAEENESPIGSFETAKEVSQKKDDSSSQKSESEDEDLTSRFVSKLKLDSKNSVDESVDNSKSKKKNRSRQTTLPEAGEEPEFLPRAVSEDLKDEADLFETGKSGKNKKRRRANKSSQNCNNNVNISNSSGPLPQPPQHPAPKGATAVEDDSEDEHPKPRNENNKKSSKSHQCGHCKEYFDSRSKLFKHLEKTGHALPPDAVLTFEDDRKSAKKSKAKRK